MNNDYYFGYEAQQFAFFRIPKVLVKDKKYKKLSSNAKILYGLMLERMELSITNNWFDDDGKVYIYYTAETIHEELDCCVRSAKSLVAELKEVGLIEIKRQGQGKPAIIYVKKFVSSAPVEVQKPAPIEVQDSARLEVQNLHLNKTELNNTELNKTEYAYSSANEVEKFDDECISASAPPKPSLEEIKNYIFENNLVVDARAFYEHFERTGWRHEKGKSAGKPVSNWKNTLLTWNRYDLQRAGAGGGCVKTQGGRVLTADEQNRLCALKASLEIFDEENHPQEHAELLQEIRELEGRCA